MILFPIVEFLVSSTRFSLIFFASVIEQDGNEPLSIAIPKHFIARVLLKAKNAKIENNIILSVMIEKLDFL